MHDGTRGFPIQVNLGFLIQQQSLDRSMTGVARFPQLRVVDKEMSIPFEKAAGMMMEGRSIEQKRPFSVKVFQHKPHSTPPTDLVRKMCEVCWEFGNEPGGRKGGKGGKGDERGGGSVGAYQCPEHTLRTQLMPFLNRRATHQVKLDRAGVETTPLKKATSINLPMRDLTEPGEERLSVTLMDVHGTEVWRETRIVYIDMGNGNDRETPKRESSSCPSTRSTRWNCAESTSSCACSGHGTCSEGIGECSCEPDWYGLDCSHGIRVRNHNQKPHSARTSHCLSLQATSRSGLLPSTVNHRSNVGRAGDQSDIHC